MTTFHTPPPTFQPAAILGRELGMLTAKGMRLAKFAIKAASAVFAASELKTVALAAAENVAVAALSDQPLPKKPELLAQALKCIQKKDDSGYRSALNQWLMEAHGVKIGDTVAVHGWAKPREVCIDSVELTWRCVEEGIEPNPLLDTFVWFKGPTRRNGAGCDMRESGGPAHIEVHKMTPSKALQQHFSMRKFS